MTMSINFSIKNVPKPRQIRALIVLKGTNCAEIGRRVGVSRQAIHATIDGIIKSYRLRKAIADALDLEVKDIWPEDRT